LAVAGSQSEKTKDEEQKESERGEDGHVSEVRIPIGPGGGAAVTSAL
jgi:hypothetical protein